MFHQFPLSKIGTDEPACRTSLTLERGALIRITSRNAATLLTANGSQALFMYAQYVDASR